MQEGHLLKTNAGSERKNLCLVCGQNFCSMEACLSRAEFLEAILKGGLLSKQEKNCMSRAVELGVSLAKVESSFELTDSGEKELRQTLQHFFQSHTNYLEQVWAAE